MNKKVRLEIIEYFKKAPAMILTRVRPLRLITATIRLETQEIVCFTYKIRCKAVLNRILVANKMKIDIAHQYQTDSLKDSEKFEAIKKRSRS